MPSLLASTEVAPVWSVVTCCSGCEPRAGLKGVAPREKEESSTKKTTEQRIPLFMRRPYTSPYLNIVVRDFETVHLRAGECLALQGGVRLTLAVVSEGRHPRKCTNRRFSACRKCLAFPYRTSPCLLAFPIKTSLAKRRHPRHSPLS